MAAVAGYGASLKKSGTSTAFTTEAMTNTSGNTWRINATAKRVWNRNSTLTFFDNTVEISSSDISSIDYLYGKVTFTGSKTGPIAVTGAYMPMATVAGAKEFSLTRTSAILDDTDLSNNGYVSKVSTIHDVSVNISRFDDLTHDFTDIIVARTPIVIELAPTSSKSYRGWFVAEGSDQSLDINALIEEGLTFQLDGDDETGKTFSRSDA